MKRNSILLFIWYRMKDMNQFIQSDTVFYILLVTLGVGGFFSAVIWPTTAGFYGAIIAAATAGIGVTVYIYYSKHVSSQLACPSGDECNEVVTSAYSKFFGIPLEYLGMLYYSVIFIGYAALIIRPVLQSTIFVPIVLILTAASALFSAYLVFVQAFIVRKWCIWCLLSAALSSLIFVLSLVSLEGSSAILARITPALEAAKQLGFVLGMGGATTAMLLFVRFLKDKNISKKEAESLKDLTELIWIGLGLILLSEYARYVAFAKELVESSNFVAQIIALSVVFISAATVKVFFSPFLDVLPFTDETKAGSSEKPSPLVSIRKATLITSSIMISSWYFAFILNFIPSLPLVNLLLIYAIFIAAIVGINLVWQASLSNSSDTDL
jgi:uncharacterized membrane protein